MICQKCGKEFEGNFCPECGWKVEKHSIKCVKCGTIFEGSFCPKCGASLDEIKRVQKRKSNITFAFTMAFVLIVFGSIFYWIFSPAKSNESKIDPLSDESLIVFSQQAVKQHLKAPSSALFPDWDSGEYQIKESGDNKFIITGYVESQNSFGTMLKSNYKVEEEYWPDTRQYHEIKTEIK